MRRIFTILTMTLISVLAFTQDFYRPWVQSDSLTTNNKITFNGQVVPSICTIADSTINWASCNEFSKTLTANQRFVFTNLSDGQVINITIKNSASYTITWVSSVAWKDGVVPTQSSNRTDIYTCMRMGNTTYGSVSQAHYIPVVVDNTDSSNFGWQNTNPTLAITVGSGSNQYLIIGVAIYKSNAPQIAVDSVVVDGTGGGKMDSLVGISEIYGTTAGGSSFLFGRKNLSAGSHTITVYKTYLSIIGGVGVVSLFNVNQTTPTGAVASVNSQATSSTLSISNTTNAGMVVDLFGTPEGVPVRDPSQAFVWGHQHNVGDMNGWMSYKSGIVSSMKWSMSNFWFTHVAIVVNSLTP